MAKVADRYLEIDKWGLVEKGFHKDKNQVSESLFSIANEYCGVRGYMEEGTVAPSLQGCYFNGVYEWAESETGLGYKGIIRRGHFMVNAVNWLYTSIEVDGRKLDVAESNICDFVRTLNFKSGEMTRSFTLITGKGNIKFTFSRFLSMTDCQNAFQKIEIESNYPAKLKIVNGLTFNTKHWGKQGRWHGIETRMIESNGCAIFAKTQTTEQYLLSAQKVDYSSKLNVEYYSDNLSCGFVAQGTVNGKLTITKCVTNLADKSGKEKFELFEKLNLAKLNYQNALKDNIAYWKDFWEKTDIEIDGDDADQQGIRFCMFQLQQTYHGLSPTDNIGAKGLTGEAYSGHAFWDTETYCLPYFMFNNIAAAKDLLLFRYNTLSQAKERAKMLDCKGTCYPIATLNGNEACDLWQHASLQFQPSTAVAYGIRHYVNISGDEEFLLDYGLEMLVEISRFLLSRGDYGADGRFGYYCVMGPDEFQMMVNHNCYTNLMAKKTFEYTLDVAKKFKDTPKYDSLNISDEELKAFKKCAEDMYIPYDEKTKLFEQHDGFFKLPHVDVKSIPTEQFPLYSHWSYDRIYRNDMIKQPDVLMFMFLHNCDFTIEQKKANYEYYEPRCIHESSLSPSVHSIIASELGKDKDALNFFGFACRLDLDDYNRNSCEGIHTTSIAAAWMNIVYGFGGVRSDGEKLIINPTIPKIWKSYMFRINYRNANICVKVEQGKATVTTLGKPVEVIFAGRQERLTGEQTFKI